MVFGYSWKRPQSNISLFFILFCSCQSCCQKIIITICGVVVIFHVCCCCSLMLARASAAESLLRVYTRIIERLASLSIQCMMLRQEPKRLLEGELLRISIQWLTQVFCGVIKTFLQLCWTFSLSLLENGDPLLVFMMHATLDRTALYYWPKSVGNTATAGIRTFNLWVTLASPTIPA